MYVCVLKYIYIDIQPSKKEKMNHPTRKEPLKIIFVSRDGDVLRRSIANATVNKLSHAFSEATQGGVVSFVSNRLSLKLAL